VWGAGGGVCGGCVASCALRFQLFGAPFWLSCGAVFCVCVHGFEGGGGAFLRGLVGVPWWLRCACCFVHAWLRGVCASFLGLVFGVELCVGVVLGMTA
jgi:hypothetical protein